MFLSNEADVLREVRAFAATLADRLKLEGETTVEGPSVGILIGLKDVRATLAMMRTPDGQGIELDKFHTPNNQFWAGGRADEHAGHPSRHVRRR
jgi:hypothetical protein